MMQCDHRELTVQGWESARFSTSTIVYFRGYCQHVCNSTNCGLGSFHSVPVGESSTEPALVVAAYFRAPGFLRSRQRQFTFSHCACI